MNIFKCFSLVILLLISQLVNASPPKGDDTHITYSNLPYGYPQISSIEFAKSINATCQIEGYFDRTDAQMDADTQRCVISKLKMIGGESLEGIANKEKIYLYQSKNLSLFIQLTKNDDFYTLTDTENNRVEQLDGHTYEITLFTEKSESVIDSLLFYSSKDIVEALSFERQYYYIDDDLTIWTLEITGEEEGALLNSWVQYGIDATGKINQQVSYSCSYGYSNNEAIAFCENSKNGLKK